MARLLVSPDPDFLVAPCHDERHDEPCRGRGPRRRPRGPLSSLRVGGVALALLIGVPGATRAQMAACSDAYKACYATCERGAAGSTCKSGCRHTLLRCTGALRGTPAMDATGGSPVTSADARSAYGVATIAEPLSDVEVRAQGEALKANRYGEQQIMPILLTVEQSFVLDQERLPANGAERARAAADLRRKYDSIDAFCIFVERSNAVNGRDRNSPVRQFVARFRDKQARARLALVDDPDVKLAWLEGRVSDGAVALTPRQRIDWTADRRTLELQRKLLAEGFRAPLFSQRNAEIDASKRESDPSLRAAAFGEPTNTEIGLALLRVYGDHGGLVTTSFESEIDAPNIFADLRAPRIVNRIVHEEKDGPCVRVGRAWRCNTRVWLQVFARGDVIEMIQSVSPAAAQPLRAAWDAAEAHNGQPGPLLLESIDGRWQAPELAAQSAARLETGRQDMLERELARRCAEGITNPSFHYVKPAYCYNRGL